MKKDLTLVILAAGMGSRFGGLKQVEPIGPNREFIIDYSIYNAIQAGFNKVVFVIKKENYDLFRETVGKRVENKIKVEYVFQEIEDLPEGIVVLNRTKPWGTAHAVLACRDKVTSNFVMINSDDFYGKDAFFKASEFFNNSNDPNSYMMVAFKVINTMTENGSVKRGVCESKNSYLTNIIESSIERKNNLIVASPLDGREEFNISEDTLVSMNFFGFTPEIFKVLEKEEILFLKNNKLCLEKCEFLIPDVVFKEINNNKSVKVLMSNDKWLGVTYKEDKEFVVSELNKLIENGEYPYDLWK